MYTFKESGELLDTCQENTAKIYPECFDVVELILQGSNLTLSNIPKQGMIMTDTCAMVQKIHRL